MTSTITSPRGTRSYDAKASRRLIAVLARVHTIDELRARMDCSVRWLDLTPRAQRFFQHWVSTR